MMVELEKDWLTVVEAAKLLGVSEKTIRRGVANGSIPHQRPGGRRGSIRIPSRYLAPVERQVETPLPGP